MEPQIIDGRTCVPFRKLMDEFAWNG
ncbi:hypothetical protein [Effusibacillus consociatus]|uniref:Uncharacterized protein n=1 Tax=Effusibacillus consociatus TaxID=1117041 RepID=A0ABV9QA59_9BACL